MKQKPLKLRPLADRVIVKRDDAEETFRPGGLLVVPQDAQKRPDRGEVIAVGPGKELEDGTIRPVAVTVGETVLFGKYSGSEVVVQGQKLHILREDDVLGVVVAR